MAELPASASSAPTDQTCLEQKTDTAKGMAEGGEEIITFSNLTPTKRKKMAVKDRGWHMVDLCKNKRGTQFGSLLCPQRKEFSSKTLHLEHSN